MCRIALVCALLALSSPGAARAQGAPAGNAPPGNSAVDQYVEQVPAADGGRPTDGSAAVPAAGRPTQLSAAEARALARMGDDGGQAARIASASAPPKTPRKPTDRPGAVPGSGAGEGAASSSSVIDAVLSGANGDGLGPALPLVLGATAIGGAAFLLVRRRGPV
jgi:hypothetical protein